MSAAAAPSDEDDRPTLADRLSSILNEIPTVTDRELWDRHFEQYPVSNQWRDERNLEGPAPNRHKYRPDPVDLPGFGDPYDGSDGSIPCGGNIPHVCKDCGERIDLGRTCSRSVCRRCAPAWVMKTAKNPVARIMSAAKMKSAASGDGTAIYKHHVAASPPPGMLVDADDPIDACLSALQDFMREIDMDGIIVYHPYRGADEEDEDAIAVGEEGDWGEWKKRLFNDRDWYGDVLEELEHEPHFHIIGACEWFPGGETTKQIEEKTGWLIKRLTERNGSPVSLGEVDDVARATTYALSHAGIDTSGERNRYRHAKVGSAYHNASGPAHEANVREAKDAIKKVAPTTLGMPSMEYECRTAVPEDESEHDHTADDLEGDGDLEEPTDDEPGMTRCRGDLVDVDDADFVDEEEWQQRALFAEEAIAVRRAWQAAGGWQGWSGQSTLSDDDPPPD